jgi:hypothetical protein
MTMNGGKRIRGGVAAMAILAGVLLLAGCGNDEPPTAERSTSSSGAAAMAPAPEFPDWNGMVAYELKQNPNQPGLALLRDAMNRLDGKAVNEAFESIKQVVDEGWRGNHPEIIAVLNSQAPALDAAIKASMEAPFALPSGNDVSAPVPDFLAVQRMTRLLLADARRLQAEGKPNEAARRALQAAQFNNIFNSENQMLISHLVGVAGVTRSMKTLEDILQSDKVSPDTARAIGAALIDIEKNGAGIVDGLEWEAATSLNTVRKMKADKDFRKKALEPDITNKEMARALKKTLKNVPKYETEHERVWDAILANAQKPYYERERVDWTFVKNKTDHPLLLASVPNFTEALTREDISIAHMRLAQALCALRMGGEFTAKQILDPFTGKPLVIKADKVYSLGPDMQDQGGDMEWNPNNGTVSVGDIVAKR